MVSFNDVTSKLESSNQVEKKIIDAFMTLYTDKPIEKISIKKITDLAGLNRGTFYLHYLDIYDLLDQIETKFHNISKLISLNTVDAQFDKTDLESVLPNIEFYESNLKYYKVLLCMNGKSNLEQMMKNELKKALALKYQINDLKNTELNEYALEYISSAQVAIIIHWIRNDMQIPICDISKLIQTLAINGALTYFE
jgi:AcrR family transcriptional regulator